MRFLEKIFRRNASSARDEDMQNPDASDMDFMQELAKSFESVLFNLSCKGYEFSLTIGEPEIEKIVNDRPYLKTTARLESVDGILNILLMISEDKSQEAFGSKKGPLIYADYPSIAMQSLCQDKYGLHYRIENVCDTNSWKNTTDHTSLENDILRISEFMKCLPDVKKATKFKGITMMPIYSDMEVPQP